MPSFAYSAHWRCSYDAGSATSSPTYDTEITLGGFTTPHACLLVVSSNALLSPPSNVQNDASMPSR